MEAFSLLPDPQTNGGLLVAVDPGAVALIQEVFTKNGLEAFIEPIGVLEEVGEKVVMVKN
jgi:selenide,water dikinase